MKTRLLTAMLLGAAALAGCSSSVTGKCSSDTDCKPGAKCVATSAGNACVIPEGGCFPSCSADQTCVSGACQQNQCPAGGCPAGYTCSASTNFICQLITAPDIEVTSPGSGAPVGFHIQTTAHAVAPGGTTGVRIDALQFDAGVGFVNAAKAGTSADPENYAGVINVSGAVDGPGKLVATETWNGTGSPTSSQPIDVVFDFTPPAIALVTDGGTWLGPGNTPAAIIVTAIDLAPDGGPGSGIAPDSGVELTFNQTTAKPVYVATAGTGNSYIFTVSLADTQVADGGQATLTYSVAATDVVNNTKIVSGDPKEKLLVDYVPPTGTLNADSAWHAASEHVAVTGTASDPQSGLASVALSGGTLANVAGSLAPGGTAASTFSVTADLSTQTFGATEGPFNYTVAVKDAAGNTLSLPGSIKVDNKPPAISAPSVTTAFDDGVKFFKGSNTGSLTVNATLLDSGAGVDETTIRLSYTMPGNPTAQTVTGSKQSTDSDGTLHYQFLLPRQAGLQCGAAGNQACDGTSPVVLSVTAKDKLNHAGSSTSSTNVFFDSVGPTVTIDTDTTWFARSATLTVHVTVNDGSGAGADTSTVTLSPNGNKTGCSGNVCTFTVAASQLTAGTEGALALSANANDKVGNQGTGTGSRNVDDKAPTVTISKIYPTGSSPPGGSTQVNYPAATNNTGHDGNHYFINESIHISATVTDSGSGVAQSSLQVRIDGTAAGTAFGVSPTAACDQTSSCSIEADVSLNGSNVGAFNQGSGNFTVTVLGQDKVANAGTPPSNPTVAATRFWWSRQVASNNTINGVAIHPSGDVIVTTNAGGSNDTVYALHNNGPFSADGTGCATAGIRWCYGTADSIGSIAAAPAIGEESSSGAKDSRIYVATSTSQKLLAVDKDGNRKWIGTRAASFTTTPVVAKITITGLSSPAEMLVIGGSDSRMAAGREDPNTPGSAIITNSANSGDVFQISSPMFVGGAVYVANNTAAQRITLDNTGNFNSFASYNESVAGMNSIAYGGSNLLYGAQTGTGSTHALQQFTATNPPARAWAAPDPTFGKGASGDPIVANTVVYVPTVSPDDNLQQVTIATKAVATIQTYGNPANTPLFGSDGRVYLTLTDGNVHAVNVADGSSQWNFKPGTASSAAPTMDCSGHLYVGIGDTVFAYLTDAKGLGNSTWPKFHRDSRNSGNADLATVWGVFNGTSCTQ